MMWLVRSLHSPVNKSGEIFEIKSRVFIPAGDLLEEIRLYVMGECLVDHLMAMEIKAITDAEVMNIVPGIQKEIDEARGIKKRMGRKPKDKNKDKDNTLQSGAIEEGK